MIKYDLAIIGSGPGGYIAALYASRRKLKTCLIEKDLVGGVCLNRGCVPTKSFISSASYLSCIKEAAVRGIEIAGYKVDFKKMSLRKDEAILRLRAGVETLLRANKIDLIHGSACIAKPNNIKIQGGEELFAKNIIIASGSSPAELPGIKTDEADILTSDGILSLSSIPARLAVVGGGVIGCEFASLFNTLGSKVTVIEFTERLIPTQSREASRKLEISFKRRGMDVLTSAAAESIDRGGSLKISVSGARMIEADKVLVSVGRKPVTDGLGDLNGLGIKTEKGYIVADEHLRTGMKNIYAIGDCTRGPLLAHRASYDAIIAVDNILGCARKKDYSNVPNCIWTEPQIASVGMCEEEAKAKCPAAKVAKFPYLGSGKAYLMGKTDGYAKVIGDDKGSIMGVEIFGEGACDLIAEAALAKTAGVDIEEWCRVVHCHPTLSEIWQETAHVFCGTPIHGV